jgi:hypothetical protein
MESTLNLLGGRLSLLYWITGSVTAAVLIAGCTNVLKVPTVEFTAYPNKEKIQLSVGLILSDALRTAKSERVHDRQVIIFPLGENLAGNAESMARNVFAEVALTTDQTKKDSGRIEAVLVPTVISSFRLAPTSLFVKQTYKMAVALQWELRDMSDRLIWVDTIVAEGRVPELSSDGEENTRKLITAVVDDLFLKSYEVIASSPEIQKFVSRRSADSRSP